MDSEQKFALVVGACLVSLLLLLAACFVFMIAV